jgi:hypothetical protein
MPFEDIRKLFDIPAKHFFKYLQVRDFVYKKNPNPISSRKDCGKPSPEKTYFHIL